MSAMQSRPRKRSADRGGWGSSRGCRSQKNRKGDLNPQTRCGAYVDLDSDATTGAATGEAMLESTPAFFFGLTGGAGGGGSAAAAATLQREQRRLNAVPGETISSGCSSGGSGRQTQDQVMWIELGLCKALVRAVSHAGFLSPTPVQAQAIPAVLSGSDVCVRAVTGSGKTAAFLLPLLHLLLTRGPLKQSNAGGKRRFIRAIILVPTRELGAQCQHMLQQLLTFTTGLTVALAIGGVAQSAQEAALESIPDILIATPGRLVDLLRNYKGAQGSVDVSGVELVVLDECDKMLTVTLKDQVVDILKRVPEETRQVLMFSATMTTEVDEFAKDHLFEPKNVDVGHVALQSRLRQQFVRIRVGPRGDNDDNGGSALEVQDGQPKETKRACSKRLRDAAKENEEEEEGAARLHDADAEVHTEHLTKVKSRYLLALCVGYFPDKTLIFTRYRTTTHRLHLLFTALGLSSAELQGNQPQEERFVSLQKFVSGEVRYLFSTDVASRGLDIKGVSTVVNFDMPPTLTAYIHRVGRTARIGGSGTAVSLVDETNDAEIMRKILAVSGVINSHQASTVKRRDVPEALLLDATTKIDGVFPLVREQLAAEALEAKITQAERRYGSMSAEKLLNDSVMAQPKKTWCLSPAERKRRDEKARQLYEREAEVTINHFQEELSKWNREEKVFLHRQRQSRRQQREGKVRAKEKMKGVARDLRRKSEQRLQAGVIKKLKKKKLRDARKASRAESREKNGKRSYKHRDGVKSMKKSRHKKRISRH